MTNRDIELIKIVPSARQLAYQQLEFYSFIHFTVNTFTNEEWGDGTESPTVFNPTDFDANQWVDAIQSAGMTGLILTCKHHDGFCLWPSQYTEHSVAKSPFQDGHGDIVKEVSEACRKKGIKLGIYLSPWDQNHPAYGQGVMYNDYFINQLTELLTNYGDIFAVWFDGACGEGKNGKKQEYDWSRYYACIRELQPNACINVCGPDIRWCGNEAGETRQSEWSVVPSYLSKSETVAEASQQSDDAEFRSRAIDWSDLDLGSREALANEPSIMWYPSEVNTSIRPGWFYHTEEDDQVKSLDELVHIYESAVGGNAMFLLNIPPNREGRIHPIDTKRLQELGDYLRETYTLNFAETATFTSDADDGIHRAGGLCVDNYDEFLKTKDGQTDVTVCIKLAKAQTIRRIVLKENIQLSQRIESFDIMVKTDGELNKIYEGTVVGYKKIAVFAPVMTDEVVIRINDARIAPTLSFIGIY